jgi:hypothetical protein
MLKKSKSLSGAVTAVGIKLLAGGNFCVAPGSVDKNQIKIFNFNPLRL